MVNPITENVIRKISNSYVAITLLCLIGTFANAQVCTITIDPITSITCNDDGTYDVEICFAHANPISSALVDISLNDGTADIATMEDVPSSSLAQCVTFEDVTTDNNDTDITVSIIEPADLVVPMVGDDVFISFINDGPLGGGGLDECMGESITIYNYYTDASGACADIDISGFQYDDEENILHTFPAGTVVPAGTSLTLSVAEMDISGSPGDITMCGSSQLSNSGETIFLYDAGGATIDSATGDAPNDGSMVESPGLAAYGPAPTCESCEAEAMYTEPNCCVEPSFTAIAVCNDGVDDATIGMYFVEIEVTDLGTATTIDVNVGGTTDSQGASTVGVGLGTFVFGPFTHTDGPAGSNGIQSAVVSDNEDEDCNATLEVVETFCGFDPTGDMDGNTDPIEDEPLHSSGFTCQCDENAETPVTILAQATPGSFVAGGSSMLLQVYVLTDCEDNILDVNNSGYFGPAMPQLADGTYSVYSINVSVMDYATLSPLLVVGNPVDVALDAVDGLCASGDCAVTFDISCACCNPDAGIAAAESCASICADESTGLASAGSVIDVAVTFGGLPEADLYAYAFLITDDAGNIVNVVPSLMYNAATPANFNEDVALQSFTGAMLAPGDYCIHGLHYLNQTIDPCTGEQTPISATIAEIQGWVGTVTVADILADGTYPDLFELNGAVTAAGTALTHDICADLIADDCVAFTILDLIEMEASAQCVDGAGEPAAVGEWFVNVDPVTGGTGTYSVADDQGTTLNTPNNGTGYLFGPYDSNEPVVMITYTATDDNSSNGDDCEDCEGTLMVDAPTFPNVLASGMSVCEEDELALSEIGGEATSWTWTTDAANGFSSTLQSPVVTTAAEHPLDDGIYTVVGRNDEQCADEDEVEIFVNPVPVFTLQPTSQYICEGDEVILEVAAEVEEFVHLTDLPSTLTFNVYVEGNLVTSVTDDDDDGAVSISFPAATNMLCGSFTVEAVADHNPDPDCVAVSDEFEIFVHTPDAMVCNDLINLGMNNACEVQFDASTFLEGEPMICGSHNEEYYDTFFEAYILSESGDTLRTDDDLSDYIGQCLNFEVLDLCNFNKCWGEVCIEDKVAPQIICETPMCELTSLVSEWDDNDDTFDPDALCWAFDGGAPEPGTLYDVIEFTAPCDGEFTFTMEDSEDFDGIAGIYEGPFDPLNSCVNLIAGDDDLPGVFESEPAFTVVLTEGSTYYLVSSTWGTGQMGVYTWNFEGPCALTTPCVFKCHEFDAALNSEDWNEICLPEPEVLDCQEYTLDFYDRYEYADPNHTGCSSVQLTRTWIAAHDGPHGDLSDTCEQVVLFEPIQLYETFWPDTAIVLPCGYPTEPEDIMAYFDNPLTNDLNCDFSVLENNEGVSKAFPYYVTKGCDGQDHFQAINKNVCNVYASYTDNVIPVCGDSEYCDGNVKIIRTWTLLDWCSQDYITSVQVIKSADTTPPTIEVNTFNGTIDPWTCLGSFPFQEPEHIQDDCSHVVDYWVTGPGTITSVNGDGKAPWQVVGAPKGPQIYQYHAADCCGNVGSTNVVINVLDDVPPTPIVKEDLVVSLSASPFEVEDGIAKIYAEDLDNGSHDGNCGPVRFEVRRVPGAATCFNEGVNGYNNNLTFNNNFDDNDSNNDTDGGAFVTFCCMDLDSTGTDALTGNPVAYGFHKVILRVWDSGTDMIPETPDDNYNEIWVNIRVEDKVPALACPPDVTICCGWDPDDLDKSGIAYALGNCGMLDVAVKNDAYLGGFDEVCNEGLIRRTFDIAVSRDTTSGEVTQWFGVECEQIITVEWESCWDPTWPGGPLSERDPDTGEYLYEYKDCVDAEQPYCGDEIDWPDDETIICDTYEHEEPQWPAETCDLIGLNLKSDTFFFEEGNSPENPDGACFKVLNHWTLVNYCVESRYPDEPGDDGILGTDDDISYSTFTHTQELKFYDEDPPELKVDTICIAVDSDCIAAKGDAVLVANACDIAGDCMSDWIKWEIYIDLWSDWTTDYEFSSFVPRVDLNFGTPLNELYVPPSQSCLNTEIILPEDVPASKYVHRAVWKAYDGCGNVTTETSYFTIEDKKAPTPYCVNLSTALMDDGTLEIWACDMDLGSFDNCTPNESLRWSFGADDLPVVENPAYNEDTRCTARTLDCDDLANSADGLIAVEVYVWDECDNYDFCRVEINLVDNNESCDDQGGLRSRIAGEIETETGLGVHEVQVQVLSNQPEYPVSTDTDSDGQYITLNHLNNESYIVQAEKDIEHLNGVSTLDIVLIQRHILGLQDLDSAYKLIAADVNNDQSITAFDLAEIRKLILGINTEFPSNTSWRFADADQSLNLNNAFNFDEIRAIGQLTTHEDFMDFVGIKIGDVNGSVILNATDDTETRNADEISLSFENVEYEVGEEFVVWFNVQNEEELHGFQFSLLHEGIELQGVLDGSLQLDQSNVAAVRAGLSTLSWHAAEAMSVQEEEAIFGLSFKALANGSLDKSLAINSLITKAEGYNGALEILDINLASGMNAFSVFQNEPNPFVDETMISFSLETEGMATLSLRDVTGKLVYSLSNYYSEGQHFVNIHADDLGTSGVFYYTLESGDHSQTRKMILLE